MTVDEQTHVNDILNDVLNGLPIVGHMTDREALVAKLAKARFQLSELIAYIEETTCPR